MNQRSLDAYIEKLGLQGHVVRGIGLAHLLRDNEAPGILYTSWSPEDVETFVKLGYIEHPDEGLYHTYAELTLFQEVEEREPRCDLDELLYCDGVVYSTYDKDPEADVNKRLFENIKSCQVRALWDVRDRYLNMIYREELQGWKIVG